MSKLLEKILLLIENHSESIKDAENIILKLNTTLENNFITNNEKCCFNLLRSNDDDQNAKNEEKKQNKKDNSESSKDDLYWALMEKVKQVVRAQDHAVEASERLSELIKYLADLFLSTIENPTEKNDYEILKFIKNYESDIQNFLDKECRRSVLSCLIDRIETETPQNITLLSTAINVTPTGKATETVESETAQNLAINESRTNPETQETIIGSIKRVESVAEKENSINFPTIINEINDEQYILYTKILKDNLECVKEVVEELSNDSENIANLVDCNILKIEEKNCDMEEPLTRAASLNIISKKYKKKMSMESTFVDHTKSNPNSSTFDPSRGELVVALDNALVGLEMDIRENMFKNTKKSKRGSDLQRNPRASMLRKFGIK